MGGVDRENIFHVGETRCIMAAGAVSAELSPVKILMTSDTEPRCFIKLQICMTCGTHYLLVSPGERKAGAVMIETGHLACIGPGLGRMARGTVKADVAVWVIDRRESGDRQQTQRYND